MKTSDTQLRAEIADAIQKVLEKYDLTVDFPAQRIVSTHDINAKVASTIAARCDNQKHFIARYLKATGFAIEDLELCERQETDESGLFIGFTWYCQPKRNPK